MSLGRGPIQKLLLAVDPRIEAFNQFYSDFLTSPLNSFYSKLHATKTISYNLMGREEYQWLQAHVFKLQGSVIEFGCGLSPVAEKIRTNAQVSDFIGIDFSLNAIELMRHQYPELQWVHAHLNYLKPKSFDHGICVDASYNQVGILKLVKKCRKSFLISKIHEPTKSLGPIKGFTKKEWDFTADYKELIMEWIEFLESYPRDDKAKTTSYSWIVIEREMKRHYAQISKKLTNRTVTLYEKND